MHQPCTGSLSIFQEVWSLVHQSISFSIALKIIAVTQTVIASITMATSSHYDSLTPLEPGENPRKPFQRHKSANDAASHCVSPLTKSPLTVKASNKDELVASVEVGT